jgi:hypothetical protein
MLVRSLLKVGNAKDTPLDKRLDILDKSMKWVAIKHKVDGTETGEGSQINAYSNQINGTGQRAAGANAGARLSKTTDLAAARILRDAKRNGKRRSDERADAGNVQGDGTGSGGAVSFAVGRAERIPPVGLNGHGPEHPVTEDGDGSDL